MALVPGDKTATTGMAAAIYQEVDTVLSQAAVKNGAQPQDIAAMEEGWKLLSFGVAGGVVKYLQRQPSSETEYAEAFSSTTEDPVFWSWLAGFVSNFQSTWTPVPNDGGLALKTALMAYLSSHPVPSHLSGVIR